MSNQVTKAWAVPSGDDVFSYFNTKVAGKLAAQAAGNTLHEVAVVPVKAWEDIERLMFAAAKGTMLACDIAEALASHWKQLNAREGEHE